MLLGKLDSNMQKYKHKVKLKMDKDLKAKTRKLIEESTGSNISDIGHSNIFLDMSPEARGKKAKIHYWHYIKITSFCTAKETINKTKRQPTEWKKIFATDKSEKGLISKIYEVLIQLNTQKTINPFKNWEEDLDSHFFKEDIQMANRHMKRCSTSLREKQIKGTMRYYLTPIRITKIKKTRNNKCQQGCGEKGILVHWW